MIRKVVSVAVAGLWMGSAVWAQEHTSMSAEFLTWAVGARSAALGNADVCLGDDALALFSNPARLARSPWGSSALGRTPRTDMAALDHAAISHNFGRNGAVAVGATFVSYGDIPATDVEGFNTGNLSPQESQVTAGYARHLPPWPVLGGVAVGGAVKTISSKLVNTARTTAIDLGLISPPYRGGKLTAGFALSNWGPGLTYTNMQEPLPLTARLGLAYQWSPRWMTLGQVFRRRGMTSNSWTNAVALGVEYKKTLNEVLALAFRSGYNGEQTGTNAWSGTSLGMGLVWRRLRLDYFARGFVGDALTQGMTVGFQWAEKGRGLPPVIQSLVDRGNRQVEEGQYPEAVLTFFEALKINPATPEAREGLERAHGLMTGQ